MFGKAIIATVLGAVVTGGAVYVAANPELLEAKSQATTPDIPADDNVTGAEPQTTVIKNLPASDTTPQVITPDVIEDEQPFAPVLPEAKQLTERTVVTPPKVDIEIEAARLEAAERVENARVLAAADQQQARRTAASNLRRIMAQAERIGSIDLQDQAYLSAVEFALTNDDFRGAGSAMEALSQPQLRDTARSKIAVKYARTGKTDAAFKVIDQVEIDDLRDFMRLQVIEAVARRE